MSGPPRWLSDYEAIAELFRRGLSCGEVSKNYWSRGMTRHMASSIRRKLVRDGRVPTSLSAYGGWRTRRLVRKPTLAQLSFMKR